MGNLVAGWKFVGTDIHAAWSVEIVVYKDVDYFRDLYHHAVPHT